MSLTEKLYKSLTIRKIAVVMIFLAVIPILIPLGLPMPVSSYTKDFVKVIEDLPDGSVIGYMWIQTTTAYSAYGKGCISISEFFIQHKLKLIICTNLEIAPVLIEDMVQKSGFKDKGYKYGVDYVIMPAVPGGEAAWTAIASNFQGVFSTDYYKTPISQLELVKNLKRLDERVKVIFFATDSFDDPATITRQFGVPYGLPILAYTLYGTCAPFYPAYIKGVINFVRGASELEFYRGLTPRNTSLMDARNLVDYAWIGLMVLGNIVWIKRERKELEVID